MKNGIESYRIAIVEDELVERRLYQANLTKRFGYQVDIYESGEDLLSFIGNCNPYDLILVDQILPGGMSGLMTLNGLKEAKVDVPVIMVTAFVSAHLIFDFVKAGGAAYVPKPIVDWDYLDYEMRKAIENKNKRKELERMTLRLHELETKQKTAEIFMDMIAHELRNPITVISGNVELLLENEALAPDEEAMRQLRYVSQYSGRLSAFLDSILGVCSVNKKRAMELFSVDLSSLLQSAAVDIRRNFIKSGVELEFVNYGSSVIRVNPDQLFQILLKLIDNSIKYSSDRPKIRVISQESLIAGYMEILVTDNGIGMSESDLQRVFDKFHRVEELEDVEGCGLGLYISKLLVEAMGGEIWVSSKKGQGSTFGLRLKKTSKLDLPSLTEMCK